MTIPGEELEAGLAGAPWTGPSGRLCLGRSTGPQPGRDAARLLTAPGEAEGGRPVWLDVTRLIERALLGALAGIDRVELSYAEILSARAPEHTEFVTLGRWSGRLNVLPRRAMERFVASVRAAWQNGRPADCRAAAARLLAGAALAPAARAGSAPPLYLLVSHRHLHREAALVRLMRRSGAWFVPVIHDVIPLDYPEYCRPSEHVRHLRRMTTVARLADGVVVISAATGAAVAPYLPPHLPVHVAPLGVSLAAESGPLTPDRPYFLCVGTIEPRKNHMLLLLLWRRLIAVLGDRMPRLVLVGRRGWENENVIDLLERCTSLRGHVIELGPVSDSRLSALLRGSRALLMPTFAEGFGLPVAEALASGVPVLCSDLPALREAGGSVPDYLDPMDFASWSAAVQDYAGETSPRRAAQLARMADWQPVSWAAHVGSVLSFADHLATRRHVARDAAERRVA